MHSAPVLYLSKVYFDVALTNRLVDLVRSGCSTFYLYLRDNLTKAKVSSQIILLLFFILDNIENQIDEFLDRNSDLFFLSIFTISDEVIVSFVISDNDRVWNLVDLARTHTITEFLVRIIDFRSHLVLV